MSEVIADTDRLKFFGIGERDFRRFPRIARAIRRHGPRGLARLYEKIAATPAVARFFPSTESMGHARKKQLSHWLHLFGGTIDSTYHKNAEVIGHVHARIGLSPTWYIGGYAMVLEDIIAGVGKGSILAFLGRGRLVASLVKVALFDMDIALSAYFRAEEAQRTAVIGKLGTALEAMAKGDFTYRLTDLPEAFGAIEADFETMRNRISAALAKVSDTADGINTGSGEISQASEDLAKRTEAQAASLEETAAAMTELTLGVRETAEGASTVKQSVAAAHQDASEGGEVAKRAVSAMDGIQRSANEIGQIISVIDGIAFQTNLLALNAGVEAARAGEAGKGFAVVANEVRELSQRTADSARHIKELIDASSAQVADGAGLVRLSGEAFNRIVESFGGISALTSHIAELAGGQASSLHQVNAAVNEMDRMTQQNAAMVEETSAAARNLAGQADALATLVARFQTDVDRPTARVPRLGAPRTRSLPVRGNLALKAQESGDDEDWTRF